MPSARLTTDVDMDELALWAGACRVEEFYTPNYPLGDEKVEAITYRLTNPIGTRIITVRVFKNIATTGLITEFKQAMVDDWMAGCE